MKTFILTVLGIIMTTSISSADIIDDMFSKPFVTETTQVMKKALGNDVKYGARFGLAMNFEEEFNKFLKTTDFVFFKKWYTTEKGTRCCSIWDTSKVYLVCIDGILLVVCQVSN